MGFYVNIKVHFIIKLVPSVALGINSLSLCTNKQSSSKNRSYLPIPCILDVSQLYVRLRNTILVFATNKLYIYRGKVAG